jgi:hypothetical protein
MAAVIALCCTGVFLSGKSAKSGIKSAMPQGLRACILS